LLHHLDIFASILIEAVKIEHIVLLFELFPDLACRHGIVKLCPSKNFHDYFFIQVWVHFLITNDKEEGKLAIVKLDMPSIEVGSYFI